MGYNFDECPCPDTLCTNYVNNIQLLLVDLSSRLPYGVIVKYKSGEKEGNVKITCGNIGYVAELGNGWWKECKPYLRPMSSMTEEEKEELKEIGSEYLAKWENAQDSIDKWILDAEVSYKRSKFYNSHFLDWHGLIPKNLAIEAPVDMYKID